MPKSTGERLWWIAGGLGGFLLVLVGWFFLISPQRSHTSDVERQVGAARQQNAALQARIDSLREQNAHLAQYQAALHKAQLALPSESGLSDFLRTLQELGNSTGTDVEALTVGNPTAITPVTPTVPGRTTSSSSPAPAPAPAPAAGGAVTAPAGLYGLPISAQVSGPPVALGHFLDQLQSVQPRAVLITKLLEGTDATSKTGGTSLQITMQAFVDTATATVPTVAPSVAPTLAPS